VLQTVDQIIEIIGVDGIAAFAEEFPKSDQQAVVRLDVTGFDLLGDVSTRGADGMSVEKLMEFHDESLRDGPCHHRRETPQSSACASLHAPTMTISEIRALDDSAMIPMTSGTPEAKPRTNASNPTGQPMLMSRPSGHTPVAESMRLMAVRDAAMNRIAEAAKTPIIGLRPTLRPRRGSGPTSNPPRLRPEPRTHRHQPAAGHGTRSLRRVRPAGSRRQHLHQHRTRHRPGSPAGLRSSHHRVCRHR